ncbi:hypothetical protein K439DRAFT_1620414 [Ramaria rubella]|nr:hypothetical protein K439DRAFT_1620414 [Ramaria rubella]
MTMNMDKNGGAVSPINMRTEKLVTMNCLRTPAAGVHTNPTHMTPYTHDTLYTITSTIAGHATCTHAPPAAPTPPQLPFAPTPPLPHMLTTSLTTSTVQFLRSSSTHPTHTPLALHHFRLQYAPAVPLRPVATLELAHAVHRPRAHAVLNQQFFALFHIAAARMAENSVVIPVSHCTLHASCTKNIKPRLEVDIDGLVGHCQRWLIITMNSDLEIQDKIIVQHVEWSLMYRLKRVMILKQD